MALDVPSNVACACALWFAASRFIKRGARHGLFSPGPRRVALFALSPLLAVGLVEGTVWALATPPGFVVESVALQTAVATMLDGVALTWVPGLLYSRDDAVARVGAAWLLWGVGLGLTYALKRG